MKNGTLKKLLWVGAVVVMPGLGVALLAKKIASDRKKERQFREYVRKTYGNESSYHD
jgi:hypothetical protein